MNCCSDVCLPQNVANSPVQFDVDSFLCFPEQRLKDWLGTSAEVGNFFLDAGRGLINTFPKKKWVLTSHANSLKLFSGSSSGFWRPQGGLGGSMQGRNVVIPHNHPAVACGAFLAVTNRWHFWLVLEQFS